VVILKKQIRVKDEEWIKVLNKLRVGQCDNNDLQVMRNIDMSNPKCEVPDFESQPWSDAIMVTPRHVVREKWNHKSVKKHCIKTGNRRYIVPSEDIDKDQENGELTMEAKLAIAELSTNHRETSDIANRTRGTISDILLDGREEVNKAEDGTIKLKYPPQMVLFKPNRGTNLLFPGMKEGLIPICPSQVLFTAKSRSNKTYKVIRRQFAMTPGYTFTDYKSQGQTIKYVIMGISPPPTGKLSPFGVYIALSRSRGRDTIRLLRGFDKELFRDSHHQPNTTKLQSLPVQLSYLHYL